MIVSCALWGTLLPPTLLNYLRWANNGIFDRDVSSGYHNWQKDFNWPGRDVENSPIDFINSIDRNNYYVFISSQNQEEGFQEALNKFNLRKYIYYTSPKFINPNHPNDGPCLTLYIFNFKEYSNEQ